MHLRENISSDVHIVYHVLSYVFLPLIPFIIFIHVVDPPDSITAIVSVKVFRQHPGESLIHTSKALVLKFYYSTSNLKTRTF